MQDWVRDLIFLVSLVSVFLIVLTLAVTTGRLGYFPVWTSLLFTGRAGLEMEVARCARGPKYLPARRPGDLNQTFGPFLASGAFAEYGAQVVSVDPWIVYFDHFLQEAEVAAYEEVLFSLPEVQSTTYGDANWISKLLTKVPFVGALRRRFSERRSLIRVCDDACTGLPIVVAVEERASKISHVPREHFEASVPFIYHEGGFYKQHLDNGHLDHLTPSGSRLFTFIVYLSDVKAGGGTRFTKLGLEVPAKRGAAVLFANTLDDDPLATDNRTLHEGMPVLEGTKRGVNLWLRQYNYREFATAGCAGTELSAILGWLGKAAVTDVDREGPRQPLLSFHNEGETVARVMWLEPKTGEERLLKELQPGESHSTYTFAGHEFRVRSEHDGTLLSSYVAGKALDGQEVVLPARVDL